ncbi:MAG: hypothetical protein ABR881_26060 [Candidatus Sulfotelmatobacter sp.]|jgi:hypothetical protein
MSDSELSTSFRQLLTSGRALKATLLLLMFAVTMTATGYSFGQAISVPTESSGIPTTLTGILLGSDGSPKFALRSGKKLYPIRGNPAELTKYVRRRVTIIGEVDAEWKLHVHSIRPNEVTDREIEKLVEQLRTNRWLAQGRYNPQEFCLNLTSPMIQILQVGPAAEVVLLRYLNDAQIKDQVIILLGGVGGKRSVEPIIAAMADRNETRDSAETKKINSVANLALTNITVSDVIWHHGGGMIVDCCPDDPKSCWYAWWLKNRDTFKLSATPSRNYSNYPNYGIYQQAGDWSIYYCR